MANGSHSSGKHRFGTFLWSHPALSTLLLFAFIMLPTTLVIFGQPNLSLETQRGISVTVANGCIAGYLALVFRRLERNRANAERRAQELAAAQETAKVA